MKTIVVSMLMMPLAAFAVYPTAEEAQVLYSSERMNWTDDASLRQQYCDFMQRMSDQSTPEESSSVEGIVLNGIMSIVVGVSTNDATANVGMDADYKDGLMLLPYVPFRDFPTNTPLCLAFASYIGGIRQVDYPDNFVKDIHLPVIMRALNRNRISQSRLLQAKESAFMSSVERNNLGAEGRIQLNVRYANDSICSFRRKLMEVCSIGVAGCRGVMDDAEFAAFTNQIVTASGANAQERTILFRGLAGE